MAIVLFVSFVILLFIGIPIGYAIGLSSLITIFTTNLGPLSMVLQRTYGTLNSYTMLAIPFFILAGNLMTVGGLSRKMVNFANFLVGRLRGGIAQVSIVSSMIFAGVSGSGAADTSAIGSMLLPTMKDLGYKEGWSAALVAASGTMGPIIPPSMIMIVYGSMAGVSIGGMFLGGAIPGVLMGLALMGVVVIYSYRPGYEFLSPKNTKFKVGNKKAIIADGIMCLITPLIIIAGIVFGVFTATEGGAISAVYAFVIGAFVYKELKLKDLSKVIIDSAVTTGVVLLVTGLAGAFGWILTYFGFPNMVANYLVGITTNQTLMLLMIVAFMLLLTCFVETMPAVIMMQPIFYQIGVALNYDPIYLGVVVCMAAFIGTITPPVGVLLYVASSVAKISLGELLKYIPAFLAAIVFVTILVVFIPSLVTFLPHLLLNR
ncbi:MAG TPA: TRAP transporter large permease [Clostridia bacterium]|nr:TRAP transporter large permease [Clostridia bacterium]